MLLTHLVGMTLDWVEVSLADAFCPGQAYVAASRLCFVCSHFCFFLSFGLWTPDLSSFALEIGFYMKFLDLLSISVIPRLKLVCGYAMKVRSNVV